MQLIISENEILQKEQDRLVESQTKIVQESRKRENELKKQVKRRNLDVCHRRSSFLASKRTRTCRTRF